MKPSEMTAAEALAEWDRIHEFASLSTSDLRRMADCMARYRELQPRPMDKPMQLAEKVARFPRVAGVG